MTVSFRTSVHCDRLEPRQLLAVVPWDGGPSGNGTDWLTPSNWLGDVLPGLNDDAALGSTGANPTINIGGNVSVKSILSSRAISMNAGTTSVATTATFNSGATATINGGAVSGGTWDITNGKLAASSNGANLAQNITIDGGEVRLEAAGYLRLSGTITFVDNAMITLDGAGAYLGLVSNVTLSGTGSIYFDPTDGGGRRGIDANGSHVLTIGSGITLHGGRVTIGTTRFFSGSFTIVNHGTIDADQVGESIAFGVFVSSWTNTGTVAVTGGDLNVGNFSAAPGMGTWNYTSGEVNVDRTIQNAGASLDLDATTGSWTLTDGAVIGGTITFSDGRSLFVNSADNNRLENVTIDGGDVVLGAGGSLLLSGAIGFANAGTITLDGANAYLGLVANVTLSGSGSIYFDPTDGGTPRGIQANGNHLLTIGAGVSIRGGRGIIGNTRNFFNANFTVLNQGTISVDTPGEALSFGPRITTWTNAGLVSVTGGVFNLGNLSLNTGIGNWNYVSGSVNIDRALTVNNTLTLNASTGSWRLTQGGLFGGTLRLLDGRNLLSSASPDNRLANITIDGGEVLLETGGYLVLTGLITLANNSTIRVAGDNAYLGLIGDVTLLGTGSVFFDPSGGGANRGIDADADRLLTIGNGVTVRGGRATIGAQRFRFSPFRIANNGIIEASESGQTLAMSNMVTVTNAAGGTLTGGTWTISAGATLSTPFGNITTNAATIELTGTGSTWAALGSLANNTGSFTLANGRDLAITPSGGTFTNSGVLNLGVGSLLSITGAFAQSSAGTLNTTVASPNESTGFGRITATTTAAIDGTLNFTLMDGYTPDRGDAFDVVIGGAGRSGEFDSVTLPSPPAQNKYLVTYEGDRVVVRLTSTADINNDGFVNGDDFDLYVAWFEEGSEFADFNGDGFVTGDDFDFFVEVFNS